MGRVLYRILGPVSVQDGDRELRIGAPGLRSLLAALLVRPGRTVTAGELVDWVWGTEPPGQPQRALHTAVSRLRGRLGPELGEHLRTVPGGYRLDADVEQIDLAYFRKLVSTAADTPEETAELLGRALSLWHGEPLTGLPDQPAVLDQRTVLEEERLRVTEQLVDVRLELGQHAELVAELTELTRRHPLRERYWAQLMQALHRSDRQADALAAYREVTALLSDELGIDPGEELQRLHLTVLATEPAPAPEPDGWRVHQQLPLDLPDFVGRQRPGAELAALLADPATMPVVAVTGPPGVGKSTLAVRIAHRLRSHFPDGQWFIRLAGATAAPREPADVIDELLRMCGTPPAAIPADLDARAGLLRSRLADRRVLLVLDDARSARQVRPLLPGAPGNAVLVTSRNELPGLRVLDGAQAASLDVLEPDESVVLLTVLLGADRVEREPAAVAELSRLCGRLPLALRIAAGRLADRPDRTIESYVEELRTGDRLSELAIGDEPQTAVATAFAGSYQALAQDVRRLFALLGVVPGPDVTVPAAAALLDVPPQQAGRLLDALVSANLMSRNTNRYRFYDLIRLYAERQAGAESGSTEAWRRLCEWYLHTADAAARYEYLPPIRLTGRLTTADPFCGAAQAIAWLHSELANLTAVVERAAKTGPHRTAWQLADVLRQYLVVHRSPAWWPVATAGLTAARAAGDEDGEGAMLHSLGALQLVTGDVSAAVATLAEAADMYAATGFRRGAAALLCNLGMAQTARGEPGVALDLFKHGIAELRELGMIAMAGPGLLGLSGAYRDLGELDAAQRCAEEVLATSTDDLVRRIALVYRGAALRLKGDLAAADADAVQAADGDALPMPVAFEVALVRLDLGRLDEAEQWARQSADSGHRVGSDWHEATALVVLGRIRLFGYDLDGAERHYRAAHAIARQRGYQAVAAEALLGLGSVAYGRHELVRSRALGLRVRQLSVRHGYRVLECRSLLLLTEVEYAACATAEAARYAAAATALRTATGYCPTRLSGSHEGAA